MALNSQVDLKNLPKGGFSKSGIKIDDNGVNWQNSIGCEVDFNYDKISGKLLIHDYNPENRNIFVKYKDNPPYEMSCCAFRKARLGGLLKNENKIINRLSDTRFVDFSNLPKETYNSIDWKKSIGLYFYFELDGESGYIKILDYEKSTQFITLEYENNPYKIKTSDVLKCKIQVVIGKRFMNHRFDVGYIFSNINGEFEITEQIREYEESHGGHMKWYKYKCLQCGNDCGKIRENDITRKEKTKGSCKKCGIGNSFPNRFAHNMLTLLNIDFIPEYSPKWIKPKRYDFYFKYGDKKYILEMDGAFHSTNTNLEYHDLEKVIEIDELKNKKALEHGIYMIRVDCSSSDFDFVKNNILNSELSNIFNFNNFNWDNCLFESNRSMLIKVSELYNSNMEICDISRKLKISTVTVTKNLKMANELNLVEYIPKVTVFTNNTAEESKRKVICINNLKVYNSISEANKENNCSGISGVCRGKLKSAGKDKETGEKLKWMYYEDYLKLEVDNGK